MRSAFGSRHKHIVDSLGFIENGLGQPVAIRPCHTAVLAAELAERRHPLDLLDCRVAHLKLRYFHQEIFDPTIDLLDLGCQFGFFIELTNEPMKSFGSNIFKHTSDYLTIKYNIVKLFWLVFQLPFRVYFCYNFANYGNKKRSQIIQRIRYYSIRRTRPGTKKAWYVHWYNWSRRTPSPYLGNL